MNQNVAPTTSPSEIKIPEIPHKLVRRDSKTLIVAFPGAVNRKTVALPYFEWSRSLETRTESYLCLSDPTLELDDRITLGWFIGPEGINLHKVTAGFIEQIAKNIGASQIILVGSSGGGYIAMAVSAYLAGSVAVAFSPSTTIDRVSPGHTRNLILAAYPRLTTFDELRAIDPEQVSLEALYSSPRENRFFLIQNAQDSSRMNQSFIPFAQSVGLPPTGGATSDGKRNLVIEPHGEGHIPPPKDRFHHWLDAAKATFADGLLERLERLEAANATLQSQVASLTKEVNQLKPRTKPRIPPHATVDSTANIHPSVIMFAPEHRPITIGARTRIARSVDMIGPINIGSGCLINVGGFVRSNTSIGNNVLVGPFSRFMTDSHGIGGPQKRAKGTMWPPIQVGDGTWIGSGVTILGGVTIGSGCIVASGAVVASDVPDNTMVGGVPAKVIRDLSVDEPG